MFSFYTYLNCHYVRKYHGQIQLDTLMTPRGILKKTKKKKNERSVQLK